jgi:hypothetical protein
MVDYIYAYEKIVIKVKFEEFDMFFLIDSYKYYINI